MRNCLFLAFLLNNLYLTAQVATKYTEQSYAAEEVKDDFHYLWDQLYTRHPGLFQYTSEEQFGSIRSNMEAQITDSLNEREVYTLFSELIYHVSDGHTLIFPSELTVAYYNSFELFFPLRIFWDGEKMYSYMRFMDAPLIPDGAEIISINGVNAKDIMQFCIEHMMRDGYNTSYSIWVLNNWFNEYFGYFFGHPATYDISFVDSSGKEKQIELEGVPKAYIGDIRSERYPDNDLERAAGGGVSLHILDSGVAVLTIRDFDNQILRKEYKQNFRSKIYAIFQTLKEENIHSLVLDLRDNQGGEIRNGNLLLKFIMPEPFRLIEAYNKVNKQTTDGVSRSLKKARGPFRRWTVPSRKYLFDGDVVLLVNGGSFSNSGIVASVFSDYHRGKIIGEETGGNGQVLTGSIQIIRLPHSGIMVEVPTLQFVLRNLALNTGQGIQPDVHIQPSIEDLMAERDPSLEEALRILNK